MGFTSFPGNPAVIGGISQASQEIQLLSVGFHKLFVSGNMLKAEYPKTKLIG